MTAIAKSGRSRPLPTDDKFLDRLDLARKRWHVPGASVAVWSNGYESVFTSGVLDVVSGQHVKADSLFQAGSITKVLTATLVMVLVERGMLKLDVPVRHYLPGFRLADVEASKAITLRHLLTHTSGMDGDLFTDTGRGGDAIARYVDRCALLPLAHSVGAGFSYSNSGFCVAGRVVEVVTGLTFDQAMGKYVLQPAGMDQAFMSPFDAAGSSMSFGHSGAADQEPEARRVRPLYGLPYSGMPAGTTLCASASALLRFARVHLAGGVAPDGTRILEQQSVDSMQLDQATLPTRWRGVANWALGWFKVEHQGGQLIGHDGTTMGQTSYLRMHVPSQTAAVLLCNGGAGYDLMLDTFDSIFVPLVGRVAVETHPLSAPLYGVERYVGTYANVGGQTEISVEQSRLIRKAHMRLDDRVVLEPPATLEHVVGETYQFLPPLAETPTALAFRGEDHRGRAAELFCGLRLFRRID